MADVYGAVVGDGCECAEYSDGAEVLDLDGLGLEHRWFWVRSALKGNGSRGGGERSLKLSTSARKPLGSTKFNGANSRARALVVHLE